MKMRPVEDREGPELDARVFRFEVMRAIEAAIYCEEMAEVHCCITEAGSPEFAREAWVSSRVRS